MIKGTKDRDEEILRILRQYSTQSTIAGLHYAFEPSQSKIFNFLWFVAILILTVLGAYLSVKNYIDWDKEPVVTTVTSTGLRISNIPFPSVVICSQGSDFDGFSAAMFKVIFDNLKNKTVLNMTRLQPIRFQKYRFNRDLRKNFTDEELTDLVKLNETVMSAEADNILTKLFGLNSNIENAFALLGLQNAYDPDTILRTNNKSLTTILNQQIDENIAEHGNDSLKYQRNLLKLAHNSTDQNLALKAYLSILWYSRMPCFDIYSITSEADGERATLKFCMWKGRELPCSAIFKKVVTDVGICCAFNMQEANKLFVESRYTSIITNLREEEKKLAFPSNLDTDWYTAKNEPISQAGATMGLTVILDAHTDKIAESTVNTDFQGFTAGVVPSGDFPIISINQFYIKPGHINSVALTAIKLNVDEDIRSIPPDKRNCFFQDETDKIKLHQNYSQSNCLFECHLSYAQNMDNNTLSCTPWFFPFLNKNHRMCDPWEKKAIIEKINSEVPVNACNFCLPDCMRVIYQPSFSTQKFRECDEKNFGVSTLCNLKSLQIRPQVWSKQVLDQLGTSKENIKLKEQVESSQRKILPIYFPGYLFTNLTRSYDAYEKDVAVLNVFFASPTVMEYTTKPSKTWFDFISAVGGNGGLFIGFSIVTVLELLWLLLKIGKYYLQPNNS